MEKDTVEVMGKKYRRVECAGENHKGVKFTATDIARGGMPHCLCGEPMGRVDSFAQGVQDSFSVR